MARAPAVAVAGGSIGGLAAGIALRGIGAGVQVYEREPGALTAGGAGIVVQPDLLDLLARHHAPALSMTGCSARRYLAPDGRESHAVRAEQRFTSWQAIYRAMRACFDDDRYHRDARVGGHGAGRHGVTVAVDGDGEIEADLLVAADGEHSATRRALCPEAVPRYAGYVAWRGTVAETAVPDRLRAVFDERFTFCQACSGGHMLVYMIPGEGARAAVGARRLNWVWYVAVDEDELADLLVDREGRRHHASLGPGALADGARQALGRRAEAELAPVMAELIAATPEPFVQTVVDLGVERTVHGRVMLLGDAAFVVRPHTAAAAAKACFDATRLARALAEGRDLDRALAAAERDQMEYGQRLLDRGAALGRDWPARRAAGG